MRIFGGLLVVAAAVALTACSGPGTDTAPSPQAVDPVSVATQGPLIGATPPAPKSMAKVAPSASAQPEDVAFFLKSAKYRWVGELPTDDHLITLGHLACDQLHAGKSIVEVHLADATSTAGDQSLAIVAAGQDAYCPETIQAVK